MADESQDEQRSGADEPTSVDLNAPPDDEPSAREEGTSAASDPGSDPSADASGELDQARPADSADADAGEAAPDGEEAPADADGAPDDLAEAPMPPPGGFPLPALVLLLAVAVGLFLAVLIVCVGVWRKQMAPSGPAETLVASAESDEEVADVITPEVLAGLGYGELMEKADLSMTAGGFATAAQLYAAAAGREGKGQSMVLMARYRQAQALAAGGQHGEAMRVIESLRAVSRPGDELWKSALIAAIGVQQAERRWDQFFQNLFLLQANAHRYADEDALNRWLAYRRAMVGVQVFLQRSKGSRTVYGVQPPEFGRAPYEGRPLMAEDIVSVSGKYGDGSLKLDYRLGEITLRAEGAPLSDVLAAVERATGLKVDCEEAGQYAVVASLEGVMPQQGLETILGSVGLALSEEDGRLVARRSRPEPRSLVEALNAALWGLQEFLILYPDSIELPEAYYALGHLYATQGKRQMALDQLGVLSREFPQSPWTVYARYVEGRASCDRGDWATGERALLFVVDGAREPLLIRWAFLWAARCQMQQSKYAQAVSSFRRALADKTDDPLSPSILYNIAFCMEKGGASPVEVEERYAELRTRYPNTEYARDADYRLACMPAEAGDYWKAASRFEFYLNTWPGDDERGRQACVDLLRCYVGMRDYARAIVLGDIMRGQFGQAPEYRAALPLLVEAYEKGRMQQAGVAALDRSLEATDDADATAYLMTEKARFLVELDRLDDAAQVLAVLSGIPMQPEQRDLARLVEASLLAARGDSEGALAACRQVALESASEPARERALRMMGKQYAASRQYEKAVLAYGGKCPKLVERSTQ